MKKLSIITCTYNSEKYLQECIDSVIDQNLNMKDYEHIFVDAYSTDKTKEIINRYAKKYSNVKLIDCEPRGVYNAMNEGIRRAKGEYIMCLNSDDCLEKDILSGYLSYIKETNKCDLYYGILNNIRNGKKVKGIDRYNKTKEYLFKNFGTNVLIYHPTCIVKKNVLIEMGLFDEDKKIASDYGMRLKMNFYKKTFCYYPKGITYFRERGNSISTVNKKWGEKECYYYKKKYLKKDKLFISIIIDIIIKVYGKVLLLKNSFI